MPREQIRAKVLQIVLLVRDLLILTGEESDEPKGKAAEVVSLEKWRSEKGPPGDRLSESARERLSPPRSGQPKAGEHPTDANE